MKHEQTRMPGEDLLEIDVVGVRFSLLLSWLLGKPNRIMLALGCLVTVGLAMLALCWILAAAVPREQPRSRVGSPPLVADSSSVSANLPAGAGTLTQPFIVHTQADYDRIPPNAFFRDERPLGHGALRQKIPNPTGPQTEVRLELFRWKERRAALII
jgi:hypothetical protein